MTTKALGKSHHKCINLKKALEDDGVDLPFDEPVATDEACVGGKEGNKQAKKKLKAGRGAVDKTAVAGVRNRDTIDQMSGMMKAMKGKRLGYKELVRDNELHSEAQS